MKTLSAIILLAATAVLSQGQPFRTSFVASFGTDNATCGQRSAPCASPVAAISHTVSGGVVKFEDAGPYDFVQVTGPIYVDGSGVTPVFTGGASSAALVITGGPVTVKNVTVNSAFMNTIVVNTAQPVIFEDVAIRPNFSGGTALLAQSDVTSLTLRNVSISGDFATGVSQTGGQFSVDRLFVQDATGAAYSQNGGTSSIRDSVIRHAATGIQLFSGSTSMIERTEISNCTSVGLSVIAGLARIGDSVITNNTLGISPISGGQIITFRTNLLAGNTTDGTTPFSISLK